MQMKTLYRAGFTIIETMLFLAISSLLIVGVIMATGGTLGAQRYHDSITSLQSVLQRQFSDINNIDHSSSTWTCTIVGSDPVVSNSGSNSASGKSDCVILGKYITTSNGKTLVIKDVVGVAIYGSYSNDIVALTNSRIAVSQMGIETYDIEWGATLKKTDGSIVNFSALMLRSPASGIIRTFINPTAVVADSNVRTLVAATYLQNSLKACIRYDGSIGSDKTALFITANVADAGGIELQGDTLSGC